MADNWNDFNNANDQPQQDHEKKDVESIKRQLHANIESVLRYLLPQGRISHGTYEVGNTGGERGKSLKVEVKGGNVGLWHDHATGEGGDVFDLWAAVYGMNIKTDFAEILEDIENWLGNSPSYANPQNNAQNAENDPKTVQKSPPIDELGAYTAKWDYFDAKGHLIACVYRYETEDGKVFRPWDVKARKYQAPTPRPLYNQPGMITAKEVILCEGEKCAQSLINIGICATTAMNGAKAPIEKTDWSPLIGKDVLIWPDKDKSGWDYAEKVGEALQEEGATKVSILYPDESWPDKYDAADAISDGLDIRTFLLDAEKKEIKVDDSWGLHLFDWQATRYAGDAPEQFYLVDKTFPLGVVSIIAAMGDTGKGMLLLNLALLVATGVANPISPQGYAFGNQVNEFGTAVIFTAEDDQNEVHRRLESLDPKRLRLREPHKLLIIPLPNAGGVFPLIHSSKDGIEATPQFHYIKEQLIRIGDDLKLIVFDPLASFIHADMNADPAAGSFSTGLLASLASETNASLIVAHHMRKPPAGKPISTVEQARDAIRGTSAIVDGVRLAYAMWPAPYEHQSLVFQSLSKPFVRNAVFQGAVVKSNAPADRSLRTYMRNDHGLLECIDDELKQRKVPEDTLKDMLIQAISRAARNGHPFTHTGESGVYRQRNRLPIIFHKIGRKRIEDIIQDLMNARPAKLVKGKATGSNSDKWLDVPDGPFAEGRGEFKHGAEEIYDDQL